DVLRERGGGGRSVGGGGVERGPSCGVAPGRGGGDGLDGVRAHGDGRGIGGGIDGGGGRGASVQRDERAGDGSERGGHLVCGGGELRADGVGAVAGGAGGVDGDRDEVAGNLSLVRGVAQHERSVGGGWDHEPDGGRSGDGLEPRGDGAGRDGGDTAA